ncbi:glycosyl transferase family 9 [Thermodesulfobium narugense DSM 14796]|uniref:Glycosyl transferase family 9 n=1 Tax=Thermodesulfobium narugense DSM 14796 TaxID=747365 RepID=M1E7I2_9BACT|nr:glycosyltransferase family 9 protein [Thermodesulfobium narugense]AEE14480.1 glycosyl transferase family 9 [Thermodesulfobium narugense DSM 14796]
MDKFIARKITYLNPTSKMTPIKRFVDFFGYRFFCKNKDNLDNLDINNFRSICIVQMGHIGDFLLSTPMISEIRKNFNGKIVLAINKNTLELASNLKGTDEVIILEHPRKIYSRSNNNSILSAIKSFSKIDVDIVLEVRGDINIIPFISLFSKYKYLVGFNVGGAGFLLDKVLEYPYGEHITETYNKFLNFFKIKIPEVKKLDSYYDLKAPNPIKEDKYIVIAVGQTGARSKDWDINNFIKLINMFLNERYTVVLVGKITPDESKEYNRLDNKKLINLTNKTSLMELFSIIKSANLFIGLDSGPTHAAAMLGVRTLALYSGVVDFNVFRPIEFFGNVSIIKIDVECEKCYKTNCENNICMKMITPEMVFDRSIELIRGRLSNE